MKKTLKLVAAAIACMVVSMQAAQTKIGTFTNVGGTKWTGAAYISGSSIESIIQKKLSPGEALFWKQLGDKNNTLARLYTKSGSPARGIIYTTTARTCPVPTTYKYVKCLPGYLNQGAFQFVIEHDGVLDSISFPGASDVTAAQKNLGW